MWNMSAIVFCHDSKADLKLSTYDWFGDQAYNSKLYDISF